MRFTEATKPDRKSGGSRGTCCAPFLNATAKGEGLKAAELLDGEEHRSIRSPDFLLSLVALASFMLLSVTKAAHAAVSGDAWQEIRVRFGMTRKARRRLCYPTQAKTGLEWGTQPSLTVKQSKKVTTSRDDKGEDGDFD